VAVYKCLFLFIYYYLFTDRLIHEGMPDGQKTEYCKACYDVDDYDEVIQEVLYIIMYMLCIQF